MMRKRLFIASLALLVLSLLVELALSSQYVLSQTLRLAFTFLPGKTDVLGITGSLRGPVTLSDIHYRSDEFSADIEKIVIEWRLADLLSGRVHVKDIRGNNITIQHFPSPTTNSKTTNITIPQYLSIDDMTLSKIALKRDTLAMNIQSLALAISTNNHAYVINKFDVSSDFFSTNIKGKYDVRNDVLSLETDWRLSTPDTAPLNGTGSITGPLDRLVINQHSVDVDDINFDAFLANITSDLTWNFRFKLNNFDAHQIYDGWPQVRVNNIMSANGSKKSVFIDNKLDYLDKRPLSVTSKIALEHDDKNAWLVNAVNIEIPEANMQLSAHGRVVNDDINPVFDLHGEWKNISSPFIDQPALRSPHGRVVLTGNPGAYSFESDFALADSTGDLGNWIANGTGNESGITLKSLTSNIWNSRLEGDGTLQWAPAYQTNLHLRATDINAENISSEFRGKLDVEMIAQAQITDNQVDATLALTRLNGTLFGYPVDGSGRIHLSSNDYRIDHFHLNSGDSSLEAEGQFIKTWDLRWALSSKNLGEFLPKASGELFSKGKVIGESGNPGIIASASGKDIKIDNISLARLDANIDIDPHDKRQSSVSLSMNNIARGNFTAKTLRVVSNGHVARHKTTIAVTNDQSTFLLHATSGYTDKTWNIAINDATLNSKTLGNWWLDLPAKASIQSAHATLDHSCMHTTSGFFCVEGVWNQDEKSQLLTKIENIPTKIFNGFLPGGIEVNDNISANIDATFSADTIERMQGNILFGPGEIRIPQQRNVLNEIKYQQGKFDVTSNPQGTVLNAGLILSNDDKLNAQIRLDRFNSLGLPSRTQPISGTLEGSLKNLALVETLIDSIANVKGAITLRAGIEGTVDAPRITGTLQLQQGRFDIPSLGTSVHDTELVATSDGSQIVRWKGSAKSGKGSVNITGNTQRDTSSQWQTTATITGSDFELARKPGTWIVIDPDLIVNVKGQVLTINGRVLVPNANIEMPDLSNKEAQLSSDVVFVKGNETIKTAETGKKLRVVSQTRVTLGDNVHFVGFNLAANVHGDLVIDNSPEKPLIATGELSVKDGTYRVYGVALQIQEGRLVYASTPFNNPSLALSAIREIKSPETATVTAGIKADGRLSAPVLSLFSTPMMDETNILSYLLLGQPLENSSGTDAQLLLNAVTVLSLNKGYVVAKHVAQSLGIDQAQINREGLVLSKTITPRLSIRYQIGLLSPSNTFEMRYKLSQFWTIQTETSDYNAADLIYEIEK